MNQCYGVSFLVIFKFLPIFHLLVCFASPINKFFVFEKFTTPRSFDRSADLKSLWFSSRSEKYILDESSSIEFSSDESISNDQEFKTSCGKITCDYVKDYPTDLIRDAFLKAFGNKTIPAIIKPKSTKSHLRTSNEFRDLDKNLKTDEFNDYLDKTQMNNNRVPKGYDPSLVPNLKSYYESNVKPKKFSKSVLSVEKKDYQVSKFVKSSSTVLKKSNKYQSNKKSTKTPSCNEQIGVQYSKEALNVNGESVIVVNIDDLYKIRSDECRAERCCIDDRTPEDKVNICKTKIELISAAIFDPVTKNISIQQIYHTNGCICELIRTNQKESC